MSSDQKHVGLAELPRFRIGRITVNGEDALLAGTFDYLSGVKPGRAWLYRRGDQSLEGDLLVLDTTTHAARISVASAGLPPEFRPGASFPYFFGYFEPSVVDMVLDPNRNWIRVKYEPTDSVRIVQGGVTNPLFGEIEAGTPIPQGFRVVAQIPKGWSKERCVLCDAEIGPRHQPFGYRDQRDAKGGLNSAGYWVCERDYQQFVSRHDLGFLLT